MPSTSDIDLNSAFAALSAGDKSQVEPLFRALWPRVLGYCQKRLAQGASAEDAAQRALIKMFEQAPDYDVSKPAIGFAFALAYYECLTERKRSARHRAVAGEDGLDTLRAPSQDPEARLEAEQLEKLAAQLLDELSEAERGLVQHDEGALLGVLAQVSPAARRKRKQRLLGRLRAAFSEILNPGGASDRE